MGLVAAKCTQCGANIEVDSTKEAGICPACGTAFITEKVVQNYQITNNINVTSATINVSGADINNLLIRAQQFELSNEKDKAIEYYNKILDIDASHKIANERLCSLTWFYIGNVKVSKEQMEIIENLITSGKKIDAIKKVRDLSSLGLAEAKSFVENYNNINKSQPQQTTTNNGCYVATCVYGSYDCPQVWTLRRYRDYKLASTWYGRAFIRTYYAISPTLVKWVGKTKWFKKMWKGKLDRMVIKLENQGFENTPYQDKEWRK